jgi:hypothetical protein
LTQEERETRMRALRGAVLESETRRQKQKEVEDEIQALTEAAEAQAAQTPDAPPMSEKDRLRLRELEELRRIQEEESVAEEQRKKEENNAPARRASELRAVEAKRPPSVDFHRCRVVMAPLMTKKIPDAARGVWDEARVLRPQGVRAAASGAIVVAAAS